MAKDIIEQVLDEAPNRRGLLKKLGVASAALAAGAVIAETPLKAAAVEPSDVVQFALNLEYLEAEFYSKATTGKTLEQRGFDFYGIGAGGPTTSQFASAPLSDGAIKTLSIAYQIGEDELAHVLLLRTALFETGYTPIAKPAINLDALAPKGASIKTQASFLTLARIFEDIGMTAYSGGASLLSGSPYLMTAARILAIEGSHAANLRLQIALYGIPSAPIDAADIIPPPSGTNYISSHALSGNLDPSNTNGLCAYRTPGQVLYLAYGGPNLTKGGFFPNGVNGALNTSSAAATTANLS